MNLDDAQRKLVVAWIGQGLKLSEIQKRLETELGLRLTYMEVKLLIGDLQVLPKDVEPQRTVNLGTNAAAAADAPAVMPAGPADAFPPAAAGEAPLPGAGRVQVAVDQITRAGAVVSGTVTFSDGKQGAWYLDQTGRLGLAPMEKGYRPPAADLPEFQAALERELAKLGY
jgi:hypothetical protein